MSDTKFKRWVNDLDLNHKDRYYIMDIHFVGGTNVWIVLFDQDDIIEEIEKHCWRIKKTPSGAKYAETSIKKPNGKWRSFYLHNLIMGVKKGFVIDHINHDTLDNRKSNLRFVTMQHNAVNRKTTRGYYRSKEKYRQNKPWFAYIFKDGKNINLGAFKTEDEAKQARLIAESKLYPNVRHK